MTDKSVKGIQYMMEAEKKGISLSEVVAEKKKIYEDELVKELAMKLVIRHDWLAHKGMGEYIAATVIDLGYRLSRPRP
jgi:hypothetical protein